MESVNLPELHYSTRRCEGLMIRRCRGVEDMGSVMSLGIWQVFSFQEQRRRKLLEPRGPRNMTVIILVKRWWLDGNADVPVASLNRSLNIERRFGVSRRSTTRAGGPQPFPVFFVCPSRRRPSLLNFSCSRLSCTKCSFSPYTLLPGL